MTPNDDQTPRTSPTPHPLDDQLPPSLFAPPGKGSPPPLFGPAVDQAPPPGGALPDPPAPAPSATRPPSSPPGDEPAPPPLFGRADRDRGSAPPGTGEAPPTTPRAGAPEPPGVSLHLGPSPDRRTGGPLSAAAADGRADPPPAGERPASGGPAPD
ncbi:membrane protease subunit, partial [Streptomyces griseus]